MTWSRLFFFVIDAENTGMRCRKFILPKHWVECVGGYLEQVVICSFLPKLS